jgi:hypothetical protein
LLFSPRKRREKWEKKSTTGKKERTEKADARHIRPLELVPELSVVVPHSDSGDDGNLVRPMLLPRDALGFFHEESTDALVLEESRVARVHRNGGTVDWRRSKRVSVDN